MEGRDAIARYDWDGCFYPGRCSCCGTEGWTEEQMTAFATHDIDAMVRLGMATLGEAEPDI